jgi:hypothetical protein
MLEIFLQSISSDFAHDHDDKSEPKKSFQAFLVEENVGYAILVTSGQILASLRLASFWPAFWPACWPFDSVPVMSPYF